MVWNKLLSSCNKVDELNREDGKRYFREPWMVNICSREMLDFSVMKCDLFYSREAWLSIKMLRAMSIKDVCFVNCDFALFIYNSRNKHDTR
jgi:hypothetical protein